MKIEIRSQHPRRRSDLRALITQWLVNALGLVIVSRAVKGIQFQGDGMESALTVLGASAVLGLLNLLLKPLLVLITLPISILSLGLFLLVINAVVLLATASLVHGFEVQGFSSALWGSLLLSLLSLVLSPVLGGGGSMRMTREQ